MMRQSNFSYWTLLRPKYCALAGVKPPPRTAKTRAKTAVRQMCCFMKPQRVAGKAYAECKSFQGRVAAGPLLPNSRGRQHLLLSPNSMKRPSSYKVTFLDRLGPAGMHKVKAGGYAAAVGALSMPAFALMFNGGKTWSDLLLTLVAAFTLGAISY